MVENSIYAEPEQISEVRQNVEEVTELASVVPSITQESKLDLTHSPTICGMQGTGKTSSAVLILPS